ncbi:MAG: methyl-accepting chemotaxis protein [Hydrogenophaga sp.]|jgi:methyl-accepting chemotaxis protein
MKIFSGLRVGARLAIGFGVVLAFMAVLTIVAISRMGFMQSNIDRIVQHDAAKIQLINKLRDLARHQSVTIRDVVLQEDFSFKKSEMKAMKQATADFLTNAEKLGNMLSDPGQKDALAALGELQGKTRESMNSALDFSLSDDYKGAGEVIRQQVRPEQLQLVASLDEMLIDAESASRASAEAAEQAYKGARLFMILLGTVATVIGFLTAYLIQRGVTEPLRRAVAIAERVANGDLTQTIESTSKDEVGQLLLALQRMNQSLVTIVRALKIAAEGVSLSSGEIAAGNQDLSARTEMQASALEQTSSSMEQLGSAVRRNAGNAHQASQLANSASSVALEGGDVVRQVVQTMVDINDSSRRISEITGVIDSIAFQTNILALNAAVEAARAGEQGRGFAVVAAEVRNLAQRSAEAAREIKGLIGASVERVGHGTKLVGQAGSTMNDVVSSIQRVADIVAEISSASREQSDGVAQVGQAVTQMDQATQQNAALVEQSAAAADNLKGQAQQLVQAISVFKLNEPSLVTES